MRIPPERGGHRLRAAWERVAWFARERPLRGGRVSPPLPECECAPALRAQMRVVPRKGEPFVPKVIGMEGFFITQRFCAPAGRGACRFSLGVPGFRPRTTGYFLCEQKVTKKSLDLRSKTPHFLILGHNGVLHAPAGSHQNPPPSCVYPRALTGNSQHLRTRFWCAPMCHSRDPR